MRCDPCMRLYNFCSTSISSIYTKTLGKLPLSQTIQRIAQSIFPRGAIRGTSTEISQNIQKLDLSGLGKISLSGFLSSEVTFVVIVPVTKDESGTPYINLVREAIAKVGGEGVLSCNVVQGEGTWRRMIDRNRGNYSDTMHEMEERVEAVVSVAKIEAVVTACREAHPYEEMGFDVMPIESQGIRSPQKPTDSMQKTLELSDKVKLFVTIPLSNNTKCIDLVRETLGNAGAGVIGDYSFCSFVITQHSKEARIETVVSREHADAVVNAARQLQEKIDLKILPMLKLKNMKLMRRQKSSEKLA